MSKKKIIFFIAATLLILAAIFYARKIYIRSHTTPLVTPPKKSKQIAKTDKIEIEQKIEEFYLVDISEKYYGKIKKEISNKDGKRDPYELNWVKIYDRENDAELIKVELPQNPSFNFPDNKHPKRINNLNDKMLPADDDIIIYDDFNFDDIKDFAVVDGSNSCYNNPSYKIFLAKENGFEFNPDFTSLSQGYCGMFLVNKEQKKLYAGDFAFIVENNKPVEIYKENVEYFRDYYLGDKIKIITSKKLIDGKWEESARKDIVHVDDSKNTVDKNKKNAVLSCKFKDFSELYNAAIFMNKSGIYWMEIYDKKSSDKIATFLDITNHNCERNEDGSEKEIELEEGEYQDVNLDGVKDFVIHESNYGPYKSATYDVYLATKKGFVFDDDFTTLLMSRGANINEKEKTVTRFEKSKCCYLTENYKIKNGEPVLEEVKIEDFGYEVPNSKNSNDLSLISSKKLVNGKWQESIWTKARIAKGFIDQNESQISKKKCQELQELDGGCRIILITKVRKFENGSWGEEEAKEEIVGYNEYRIK